MFKLNLVYFLLYTTCFFPLIGTMLKESSAARLVLLVFVIPSNLLFKYSKNSSIVCIRTNQNDGFSGHKRESQVLGYEA